jgi:hypothetical protein
MVMYYVNSQGILRQASRTYFFLQISNFNSGFEIKNNFIQALYLYMYISSVHDKCKENIPN